jgi:diaminobutyrate-2-oxoglutarate transaminase
MLSGASGGAVSQKGAQANKHLTKIATAANRLNRRPGSLSVRGRGLIQGLDCRDPDLASRIANMAFDRRLIVETCGSRDQVVKLMPPLTISNAELTTGLEILEGAVLEAWAEL